MDQAALNRLRQHDRADLERLLTAVNGASNALRRDECGDPVIMGSRGKVYACDGMFRAYVACRSPRHWHFVKKSLSGFCTAIQGGDEEGVVRLDRMPNAEEAAILRDAIGLRQTRPAPARGFARLEAAINGNHGPKPAGSTT